MAKQNFKWIRSSEKSKLRYIPLMSRGQLMVPSHGP